MPSNLDTTDAYGALRISDFRKLVSGRFLLTIAIQMQSVVVGWQIYELTHDALSLGLIGMAEAVPFLCVALFAGHIADTIDRKKIVLISYFIYIGSSIALLLLSLHLYGNGISSGTTPIYIVIFITGLSRGFISPALSAFTAQLVPKELFGNASTWNSLIWQIGAITGPALGGLICGFLGTPQAYAFVCVFSLIGFIIFSFIKNRPVPERIKDESIWQSLSAGLRFVFRNQIILSAISLDMFAVFFGGAVCILPIFADQILHTDAKGLGLLRAAPAIGAIMMSIVQVHWPLFKNAGRNLLVCVLGFGISIIIFALTRDIYTALIILIIGGMFDNVSVIIRATIIQLYTPDEMRGRVASVNGIFIGSSNELGSFESGLAAKIMGLIPSIIFGGSMTLIVVGAVRALSPKLRKLRI